jgi:putative DNA primase/helicase
MSAQEVLSKLNGVKRASDGWTARCPAHSDERNSLSVSEGGGGRALLYCHAGCSFEQIVAAIGAERQNTNGNGSRMIVAAYDYTDEGRNLLSQAIRYEPKGFCQRRPDGAGGWIYKNVFEGVRRVPYRLPELLAADPQAFIYLTEGEKDVERLALLRLIATTNAGGVGKWRPEYNEYLRGRHVVILPDNDEPGRKHAVQVARSLHGIAAGVRVLALPNLPPKGDVSDWLDAGGTVEQLSALAGSAPLWTQEKQEDAPAEELRCSDMGNGYRFARRHRLNVRYNYVSGKWYVFDGRRWLEDDSGEVYRLAKETAINILIEAAHTENEDRRKALAKWASVSEGDSKLRAMLHMAESELPVKLEVFDADPMLFNCANGTIDLRTGSLRPHRREDMLTKLSPVAYDVEAQPVRWLAFLDRVFAGDQQLIKFIQKAVGYSLAGDTSEQCLFINYGTGANGKSVFLKTIAALVGDYGQQVQTSTLMIKQHQGVNNDVATLRGARFLAATETDDGQKLAESTVKQLTGGDKVRARFLFQESFEFTPQFKIWLAANHKPEIRGNDHAIWRRIRLVPFNVTIPKAEQNPHLDAELKEELPGVLAWAVEGCLRWQREGLGEPEAVTKATADYREEQDAIAGFLSEKCVVGEHYQVTAKEIYYAYKTWCISNGEEALSAKWLGLQLRARGFLPDQDRKNRFYRGIGLIRDSNNDEVEF